MEFTHEEFATGAVLSLHGAFTFKDHHSFRAVLDQLKASKGSNHVLDLSDIDFMDSAALGMLLVAEDEAKGRGWVLTLRKPSSQISRLLELVALNTLLTIEL